MQERLDAAPPLPMEIGARSHELPMEIGEPRVRPVSGPAGGALRHAASTPALPRPASAVPATGFRRPPNVPAVRLLQIHWQKKETSCLREVDQLGIFK